MNTFVQKTVRIEFEKAELLDLIRKEKDMSWNAIIDSALTLYLQNGNKPKVPPKTEILDEQKEPEKPKKEASDIDISKLKMYDEEGPKW